MVDRPPVQGDVERHGRDLELHTQLSGDTGVEALVTAVIVETELHTRTYVEVGDAGVGEDEIIHAGHIETVAAAEESEVSLEETGAAAVLIGKFSAVTGAETECARLGGSHSGEREY